MGNSNTTQIIRLNIINQLTAITNQTFRRPPTLRIIKTNTPTKDIIHDIKRFELARKERVII